MTSDQLATREVAVDPREAILDAAEHLMAGLGYAKSSISMICRASGLPTGSIYHHFGSKAGLLAAVFDRGAARFYAAMPQPADLSGSAEQKMHDFWAAAADAIASNVQYFLLECDLLRSRDDDPDVDAVMARTLQYGFDHLGAVIEPFAREVGVPDPRQLSHQLTVFTFTFTRGAVIEVGRDVPRLRALIGGLHDVLRASILDAARPARKPPQSH